MENRHHSNHPSNVARRHAPTYSELHAKFSAIFAEAVAAAGDQANAAFDISNPAPDIFLGAGPDIFSGAGDGSKEFIEWIADEFATLFLDSVSESFIDQLEKD